MPRGFTSPSILFLGNLGEPERKWAQDALRRLWSTGRYRRYVEPGVGAFALAMVARAAGIPIAAMETSDVGFYSSVCGYLYGGRDLRELETRVDGEVLRLPDDPLAAAAEMLWTQLRLRIAARPPHAYWLEIAQDLDTRRAVHLAEIAKHLMSQRSALSPIAYEPLDILAHVDRVADDPATIIMADPPSYKAGFERFYSTAAGRFVPSDGAIGERLTWAEPTYRLWDPATDFRELMERFHDRAALLLLYQECEARNAVSPDPLYARFVAPGWTFYWLTNRPTELLPILGRTVGTGRPPPYEPLDAPILDPGYEITPSTKIEVSLVRPSTAGYYKHLWIRRIKSVRAPRNAVVLLDGQVAGVMGWDWTTITQARPTTRSRGSIQYIYGAGAPHAMRLGRLVTALACQRAALRAVDMADLYVTGADTISTVILSPYPEAKTLRGLMELIVRNPDPIYGYRITYQAPMGDQSLEEVLRAWLVKEAKRLAQPPPSSRLVKGSSSA